MRKTIMQMNNTYICRIMAAAMMMVICSCVTENLEDAATDKANVTGVYFLEDQENIKTHTLEKNVDKTSLDFIVRRTDTRTKETIPFTTEVFHIETERLTDTSKIEKVVADNDLFVFSQLTFEEGKNETTINVRFDRAELGRTYTCNIHITDPKYVSPYDYKISSISFKVQVYGWNNIPQKAIVREGLLSDMFLDWKGRYIEHEVAIQQREDKIGYFRLKNVYDDEFIARMVEGDEEYEKDPEGMKNKYSSYVYKNHYLYLDASDTEKVYFPAQETGFVYSSYGDILIASDVEEVFGSVSNQQYGKLEDGVITFPKNSLNFGMGPYYYFGNTAGKFRVVLPHLGGISRDYGIDVEVEEITSEGKIPVSLELEKDVAYVKYAIFEGKVIESEIANKVKILDSSAEGKFVKLTPEESKNIQDITLDATFDTGIHTLVACSYDAEDKLREHDFAYLGYVKGDDNKDVEIKMGVHTDDLYENKDKEKDYNKTNSFQYWVRGKNITHASIAYYPTAVYEAYETVIKKELKESVSLGSQYLKLINSSTGFGGIVGNQLKAGTSYTLIVYAENGYHSDFFTEEITLGGTLEEAQRTYSYKNLTQELQDPDAYEGKKWVPVSIDVFDEDGDGRRYIRTKVINKAGDRERYYVTFRREGDKMIASGLFPTVPPSKTNGPEITFDIKDEKLVLAENDLDKVYIKDSTNLVPSLRFEYLYKPKIVSLSYLTNSFHENYKFEDEDEKKYVNFLTAGFVDEDKKIIAFTDNQTENIFMTMTLGGFQEVQSGYVFSTIIGDGHGELLLVEDGHSLLSQLKESGAEDETSSQMLLNSVSELNRYKWNEVNCIETNRERFDIAHDMIEFSVESRARTQK